MGETDTVLEILQTASESHAPAALMSASMAMSCPGRLKSATSEGVVLEFVRPPPGAISAGDACAVTFPLGGRTVGFMARALAFDQDAGGRSWVTLALPERIQHTEQRLAVRIPVPPDSLDAVLHVGDGAYAVEPIDLSMHGVLVEVPAAAAAEIRPGHRRMIELQLHRHEIVLECEVRRIDGLRLGLLFIQRDERPKVLAKIMSELQKLWAEDS
jgi:hypothetical protein